MKKQSLGSGGKDIVGNKKDLHIPSKVEEVKKEVPPEEDWTEEQQKRLESGLKKFSKDLEPKLRWGSIATEVGDKTAKECLARFKYISARLKTK